AFAPVDFQTQTLAEGLAASPFDAARPAFVSWLGVSMYLDEAAAMHTLGQLAACPPAARPCSTSG
ncbi:MAG TPA: class I SAM-dependent methyltransferase, partial [Caulobacteraceae bacterium]